MLAKPPTINRWKSNSASLHQTQSGSDSKDEPVTPNPDEVEASETVGSDTDENDATDTDTGNGSDDGDEDADENHGSNPGLAELAEEIEKTGLRDPENMKQLGRTDMSWAESPLLNPSMQKAFGAIGSPFGNVNINPLANLNINPIGNLNAAILDAIPEGFLESLRPNISPGIAARFAELAGPGSAFKNSLSDTLLNAISAGYFPERHGLGNLIASLVPNILATDTHRFLTTTEELRYTSNRSVWHYTNGYALMQVLKNHYLWASSPQNLNDSSEVSHGVAIIKEAFERAQAGYNENYEESEQSTKIEKVLDEVLDEDFFNEVINEVYYISASTDSDSLTLWRNYARGDGFSIGINADVDLSPGGIVFNDDDPEYQSNIPQINGWYKVHYKDPKKKKLADEFADVAITDILKTRDRQLTELVDELRKQTLILASTMKHKSFADEKEVRWMTTNWMPGPLDPVHYEHGRNSIVPVLYIQTSDDVEKPLPLRGVRCSPIAPTGITRTIEGLLKQRGYTQASKNVKQSEQPFKG